MIWHRKSNWTVNILRHEGFLHDTTKGKKMMGKPIDGRKRRELLHGIMENKPE